MRGFHLTQSSTLGSGLNRTKTFSLMNIFSMCLLFFSISNIDGKKILIENFSATNIAN